MTQYIEDFLPPIQSAGLNTQEAITAEAAIATTAGLTVESTTAVPATAGAIAAGAPITMFSGGPSIYVTSNTPTHVAVKGSLCINTGGSSTSTRLYVNTDGAGTWTSVTTAA